MTVGRSDYRNLNLVSPFNPTPTAPVSAALVLTPDVALTRSPAPIIPPAPTRCTRLNSEFAAAAARLTGPQRTGGIGGSPRARLHNSRHRPAAAGSAPHAAGLFDELDKLLDAQRFLISGVRAASPGKPFGRRNYNSFVRAYEGYAKRTMERALAATRKRHAHRIASLSNAQGTEFAKAYWPP